MSSRNSWSKTSPITDRITHTWTIENFSLLHGIQSIKELTSPTFLSGSNCSFQLLLNLENNYMSIRLGVDSNISYKGKLLISLPNGVKRISEETHFATTDEATIDLMTWKDLFEQKYYLLPNDKLILCCEIVLLTNYVQECDQDNLIKVPRCNLSGDFGALLESKEFADVTIVTADDHKIPAHKIILSARSKVFAAMFKHPMKENTENCVDIGDFSFDVVMELIRYMYTGEAPNLKEMTVDLMTAADKYGLDRLKAMCINTMCNSISIETAPMVLKTADLYNIEDLKSEAIVFIQRNIHKIRETENWKQLIKTDRKLIFAAIMKEKLQEFHLNDTSSSEGEDEVIIPI